MEPSHNIYHEQPRDLVKWKEIESRFDLLDKLSTQQIQAQIRQQEMHAQFVDQVHPMFSTITRGIRDQVYPMFSTINSGIRHIVMNQEALGEAQQKLGEAQQKLGEAQQVMGAEVRTLCPMLRATRAEITEGFTAAESTMANILEIVRDLRTGVGERGARVQNTVEQTARTVQQTAIAVQENGLSTNARMLLEFIMRYGMDTLHGYVIAFPIVDGDKTYFVVCLTLVMALIKKFKGFKEHGITTEKAVSDLLRTLPSHVISARRSTQEKALGFFCTRMYRARGNATNMQRVFSVYDFEVIVQHMRTLRNTMGEQPDPAAHEWESKLHTMWTRTQGNLMRWGERTNMVNLRAKYGAEYDAMMRVVQIPDNPAAVLHFNGLQGINYEPPVHSGRPGKEVHSGLKRLALLQIKPARAQRRRTDDDAGVEESKGSDSDRSHSGDTDDEDSTSTSGEGEGEGGGHGEGEGDADAEAFDL
jgi:hypothetical protein